MLFVLPKQFLHVGAENRFKEIQFVYILYAHFKIH